MPYGFFMRDDHALVLFSGGQDSTTCLAWALSRFRHVETLGFHYGQRHAVELDARPKIRDGFLHIFPQWADRLGTDHLLHLDVLSQIGGSALTEEKQIKMGDHGLPNTFVPGRNLLFLTVAAALSYRRDCRHIIGGMCETDYSGYPDCRDDTIKAMQTALNLGMESDLVLHTPLMWLDKAQSWRLAKDLGGQKLIDLLIMDTVTCYLGDTAQQHDWGRGCGTCPACDLRARGYAGYLAL